MEAILEIPVNSQIKAAGKPISGTSQADAAQQFEAYMLKYLLTQMRKTVSDDGLFSGSSTRGYESIFDEALTGRAAERGSFGLAEQLLRQWGADDGGSGS